tara:strand:+ start:3049 stop:3714 length:666 start_codon:yes stop_codon:yes gene_type:complete
MDKINVNYVIPMGLRCPTANFLKQNALKKTSYPFDWLKMYDLQLIISCLMDDFKEFQDSTKYIDLERGNDGSRARIDGCGHSSLPLGGDLFFHRNPRKKSDYEYFVRCIDRLRYVLKKPEPKLFITSSSFTCHPNIFFPQVHQLNEILKKITTNYYIIATHYITENKKRSIDLNKTDNILEINFKINSGMNRNFTQLANKADRNFECRVIKELVEFDLFQF